MFNYIGINAANLAEAQQILASANFIGVHVFTTEPEDGEECLFIFTTAQQVSAEGKLQDFCTETGLQNGDFMFWFA